MKMTKKSSKLKEKMRDKLRQHRETILGLLIVVVILVFLYSVGHAIAFYRYIFSMLPEEPPYTNPQTADEWFANGVFYSVGWRYNDYQGSKDREKAIESYHKVLAIDPDRTDALSKIIELDVCQKGRGYEEKVIEFVPNYDYSGYDEYWKYDSEYRGDDEYHRALCLQRLELYDEALTLYAKLIALGPRSPYLDDFFQNRGDIYIKLGEYQLAINEYNMWLNHPEHHGNWGDYEIYESIGDAYSALDNYTGAIESYENAIEKAEEPYYSVDVNIFEIEQKIQITREKLSQDD